MKKRNVFEWLELWGEWERLGGNYTKHLRAKSQMLSVGAVVVRHDSLPPPQLNDDDALWICDKLAFVKRERPHHYKILKQVHVNQMSMVRVAAFNKTSRNKASEDYKYALGYFEAALEILKAA